MWSSKLKTLRWATLVLGVSNLILIVFGLILAVSASHCSHSESLSLAFVLIIAVVRNVWMVATGIAQEATATTILSVPSDSVAADAVFRLERRMRYKRWLWWTRFGNVVSVLQFVGATYFMFVIVKYASHSGDFYPGVVVCGDCTMRYRSDVLRWRSFYATHDNAWKAHYSEVFDHGIREALCCLGRVKYLSVLEEDEVYSVARLLGDLVAYRASGTGHLELLTGILFTGLALLQRPRQLTNSTEYLREAPEERIHEAAVYHQFAEAAYTGPLLDFGRNPVLFPCAWLYRQGVLTPWTRNSCLSKIFNQSPEALRRGRVSQVKCEAAYFIMVLHHLRSVVISVRGTETPETL
ncbi:hypothetical protein GIB67_029167 [Kingdonia uniflora]|uniref:DUF7358 domain-containing protein n=1 Tax=Kingdonia uniflora TaxID=39325 RepID=A0A7J7P4R3_9MAGN|nr:hypothetical protein GIB67_029167 [Kingdonia uniflora]